MASQTDLQNAIKECLKLSTHCPKGPNGPIRSWDVSAVTEMSQLFVDAKLSRIPSCLLQYYKLGGAERMDSTVTCRSGTCRA